MANIIVFEFFADLETGVTDVSWPADLGTPGTTSTIFKLDPRTNLIVITCDADSRLYINGPGSSTAASSASLPVLSAVPNQFRVPAGSGRTLYFA